MDKLYDICGLPFGWIMRLIYLLVNNYAVAILIFTILVKLVLFPISYKQQLNSARMQRLNPKLEKLKKKYKDDQQKLQEAQMALYKEENVNPGASCLPMFLQFFILFGVLDVVYKPLTYVLKMSSSLVSKAYEVLQNVDPDLAKQGTSLRKELVILNSYHNDPSNYDSVFNGANTAFNDKMLDFYDHFSLFGVSLGDVPTIHPEVWSASAILLVMIPFLSGLFQLILTIYTQIMQKKRNPAMKNMGCMSFSFYIMPIFSVWFAFQVPAGVGFYWICSSFFSLVQTVGINLYLTPERTEKIIEKQNKKLEKKYAGGKQTFMEKLMNQQNAGLQQHDQYRQETKDLSRSELSKYNQQVLRDARDKMQGKYQDEEEVPEALKKARQRMAEKYGDIYQDDGK